MANRWAANGQARRPSAESGRGHERDAGGTEADFIGADEHRTESWDVAQLANHRHEHPIFSRRDAG